MSRFLSKTFQSWQSYAPVLDEDFAKLKIAYQKARKPINDAIKKQETKNHKIIKKYASDEVKKELEKDLSEKVIEWLEVNNNSQKNLFPLMTYKKLLLVKEM